jgi:glycine/D-amino acid oxidase-like deaminating enzyme
MNLPERARVVVVGGGVIGTSVAYHLAKMGINDVLLLERDRLTAGTTWHAAGLIVTFGSLSETSTRLRQYTRELYAGLEAETGLSTGLRQCGFIELAADEGRLEEYRRVAAFNRHLGVDVHEISPAEVRELFPLARTDDVLAGFYVAEDGRANPVDVTMSLAKGARQRGVRIVEGVPVTGTLRRRGAVTGVRTAFGDVEAEVVVNCAGMWARQLGEEAGVSIPLQAAEHYYLITEPIDGVRADLPVLEDPSSYGYFREETGGLMVGLFEGAAAPWSVDRVPDAFSFGTLPPDWDRMAPYLEAAMARIPVTATAGVRTFFCGPESFTPDLAPVFGESPELRNYFVAAGMNSIGILTGGGIGRALAAWIAEGRPDVDVTGMHIDRLQPYQRNREYRAARTVEALGQVYATHFPNKAFASGRGARRSPLHDRVEPLRPYRRDVSGWEMPDVYDFSGSFSPSWGRPEWFAQWAAEHRAAREDAIVMDMSFMAKFLVEGPEAGAALEELSANRVSHPGRVTYTQWLNEGGTIEADLTVTQLDEERFWVVASDTAHRHALTRLRRHLCGRRAFAADVTSGWAQLNVQGPRSRGAGGRGRRRDRPAVPRGRRDRDRLRPGAVPAHHLPRRAGLRALRPRRAGGPRVRPDRRGRRRARAAPRRAQGPRQPAHGEGVPRLRPRHRQHRPRAGGGAGLRRGAGQGALHRPGRGPRPARRRPAHPAAGPGARHRPEGAAVPRRGGAPRRARRGVHPGRLLRPHPRRRRGPGHARRRRRGAGPGMAGRRRADRRDRRRRLPGPGLAAPPVRPVRRARPRLTGRRRFRYFS